MALRFLVLFLRFVTRHVSGTEPLGNVSVAKEHGTGSSSVGRAVRRGFESHLLDNIVLLS